MDGLEVLEALIEGFGKTSSMFTHSLIIETLKVLKNWKLRKKGALLKFYFHLHCTKVGASCHDFSLYFNLK